MDLSNELNEINAFFDSISEEEFIEMMMECGIDRILPTDTVVINQKLQSYFPI